MGLIFWRSVTVGADIGGRATDVGQIGLSILAAVTGQYNRRIPPHVSERVFRLARQLEDAEKGIKDFAEFMIQETERDAE